jgi:hypothetical protein
VFAQAALLLTALGISTFEAHQSHAKAKEQLVGVFLFFGLIALRALLGKHVSNSGWRWMKLIMLFSAALGVVLFSRNGLFR